MCKQTDICSTCLLKNVLSCWEGNASNHAPNSCWKAVNKVARCQSCEDSNKALNFFLIAKISQLRWSFWFTGVEKRFVYKTKHLRVFIVWFYFFFDKSLHMFLCLQNRHDLK